MFYTWVCESWGPGPTGLSALFSNNSSIYHLPLVLVEPWGVSAVQTGFKVGCAYSVSSQRPTMR